MTDSKQKDRDYLYEFAQDTLSFAKRRHDKGDYGGEKVALEYLQSLVKKLRKAVDA